jgi:hypothetical protein
MTTTDRRRITTTSEIVCAVSALLLSINTPSAATNFVPKSGVVEVTGYGRVTEAASSEPITVQATRRQAATIRRVLSTLATTGPSDCVDTLQAFSITFLPYKGAHDPEALVTENDCPGVVTVVRHGKAVETLKERCSLRSEVLAILPRWKAEGTRQDRDGCSS